MRSAPISLIKGDKVQNAVKILPMWNYNRYPGTKVSDTSYTPMIPRMARIKVYGVNNVYTGEVLLGTAILDCQMNFYNTGVVLPQLNESLINTACKDIKASMFSYLAQGDYSAIRWELLLNHTPSSLTMAGSNFSVTTTTCTVTKNSHGYLAGMKITVSGVTTATVANVTKATILTVTDNNFTYAVTSGTAEGGGTATYSVEEWDSISYFGELYDMKIIVGETDIKQIMSASDVNDSFLASAFI